MKKMRKLSNFTLVTFLMLFLTTCFISCNDDSSNLIEEKDSYSYESENDLSSIEYINKCNDCANSSDGFFYFFKGVDASYSKIKKSNFDLNLIEKSLKNNEPIKIIYDNDYQIINLKPLKKNELALFKEKERIHPDYYNSKIDIEKEISSVKYSFNRNDDQTTYLTLNTLNNAVKYFSSLDHFNFDYATDGCYARAHQMIKEMKRQDALVNVYNAKYYKVWIYAKENTSLTATTSVGCEISWRYHVAPMVILPTGEKMVLDPSLEPSRAITYKEWVDLATSNEPAIIDEVYTNDKYLYFDHTNPARSTLDPDYRKSNCIMENINLLKDQYPDCGGEYGSIPSVLYGFCWDR